MSGIAAAGGGAWRWLPAILALGGGLVAAWHHPLVPAWIVLLVLLMAALSWRWPRLWLFALPAGLPWLDFAPWTGWTLFSEFDLWLLALWAGAWARGEHAARACGPVLRRPADVAGNLLVALLALSAAVGLWRGLAQAGSVSWDWFGGFEDPSNTWRVAKSLVAAVAWWPLLCREVEHAPGRAARWWMGGMVVGLAVVVVTCFWERYAYVRLFDFRYVYRTTALFWEMRVGGGAIDAFLVLAWPAAWWAVGRAPWPWWRTGALLLLLGSLYACASTFSRGVYGAVLASAVCLVGEGVQRWRLRAREARVAGAPGRPFAWRAARYVTAGGASALAVALVLEVLGPQSFMAWRWSAPSETAQGRLAQWEAGLGSLHTASAWWWGQGLGRLPTWLQAAGEGERVSGGVRWQSGDVAKGQRPWVRIEGPRSDSRLRGLYALSQRVPLLLGQRYVAEVEVRTAGPSSLQLEVCERHLLYDRRCQGRRMRVPDTHGDWRWMVLPLQGVLFGPAPALAPRLGLMSMSVPEVSAAVDVRSVRLYAAAGTDLVANGQFSEGLARWLPTAQFHFLPWHLDSLYVETLVERGLAGLLLLLITLGLAAWRLGRAPPLRLRGCLMASLVGIVLVGGVSSVQDVPRVATLFWMFLLFVLCWSRHARPSLAENHSADGMLGAAAEDGPGVAARAV